MRFFTRIVICVLAGIVLGLGLFVLIGAWFGDETSFLQLGRGILFESHRSQALRHRSEVVAHAMEIKHGITTDLLAGRLTLREAIPQFQKANELVENVDRELVAEYRTPTDPESVARQILGWAGNELARGPKDKAEAALARLEREFREMFPEAKLDASVDTQP